MRNYKIPSTILLGLFLLCVALPLQAAVAFEAQDLLFGFDTEGWRAGLGFSQENTKSLGFFGYEKTGIGAFLSPGERDEHLGSWLGGHRKVYVGNIAYTMELFVANLQRPILSTFVSNTMPHIGAYGEINRVYGEYGHGVSGTAQLYVTEAEPIKYAITPYIQFTRQGVWRFSASVGSFFGLGMSYLEPMEKLRLDITLVNDELSFHILFSQPEQPLTVGAGFSWDKLQAFVRYCF